MGIQENSTNKYVSIFGHLQYFSHYCIDLSHSRHSMSPSYFTFVGNFYDKNYPHLCQHLCSSTYAELSTLAPKNSKFNVRSSFEK